MFCLENVDEKISKALKLYIVIQGVTAQHKNTIFFINTAQCTVQFLSF